jgi:hypothetical protein
MRKTGYRTPYLVGALVLCALSVTACGPVGSSGAPAASPRVGDAAVVTIRGDVASVRIVDSASATLVRDVRLRSLGTHAAYDAQSGNIVVAVSGGADTTPDAALAIIDPRTGDVRYIDTTEPNPEIVVCEGGSAYVWHGWSWGDGMVVSVIDLASGSLEATAAMPLGPGIWSKAEGSIWTVLALDTRTPKKSGRFRLVRVQPSSLATQAVPIHGFDPYLVTDAGDGRLIAAGNAVGSTKIRLALLDAASGSVVTSGTGAPTEQPLMGVQRAGDMVLTWSWGDDPADDALLRFRFSDLGPLPTLHVGGSPITGEVVGDSLLVADASGALVLIDPETGATRARIEDPAGPIDWATMIRLGP